MNRRPALALLLGLAACQAGTRSLPEQPIVLVNLDVERRLEPLYEQARKAELLRAQGKDDEAETIVAHLLLREPLFVPAWRMHQDFLRERGFMGLVWREIEELRVRYPDRPEPLYLATRLIPDFEEKVKALQDAHLRFPHSWWILYGIAWVNSFVPEQHAWTRQLLHNLLQAKQSFPQAWALYWQCQPPEPERGPALAEMRGDAVEAPEVGILPMLAYQFGDGRLGDLLDALDRAPDQPGLLALLASNKVDRHRGAVLRHLEARPELVDRLATRGGSQVLASLALAEGRPRLAERWLRKGLAEGPGIDSVLLDGRLSSNLETLTVLLCQEGRLEEAIAAWADSLPAIVRDDPQNLDARLIQALLRGPCRGVSGPARDEDEALERLVVLREAGWIEEAVALGRYYQDGLGGGERIDALCDELERFLRYETELIEALRSKEAATWDLAALFDHARTMSVKVFGQDIVGKPVIHDFPLLGLAFVDPLGPGLPSWFARYRRYLVVGRGLGGGLQFLIGRKLGERRLRPSPDLPLLWECSEVLIESKKASNIDEVGFADPAGVAIWNHYLVDLQMVRQWKKDLDRIADMYGTDLPAVLADEAPALPPLSAARPCLSDRKAAARAVVEEGLRGEALWREILDLLRRHERAHLVDAHRFLPVMANPLAALIMAFKGGFSAQEIMAQAEGRAEIVALATGAHPRIGLPRTASFLPEPGSGPAAASRPRLPPGPRAPRHPLGRGRCPRRPRQGPQPLRPAPLDPQGQDPGVRPPGQPRSRLPAAEAGSHSLRQTT
ncbi:MAG: hypothetical protein R3F30_08410 [Planctomycetota bacterium]